MKNFVFRTIKLSQYTAETAPQLGIITAIYLMEPREGGRWFRCSFMWERENILEQRITYKRTLDICGIDVDKCREYVENNFRGKLLTIEAMNSTRIPHEEPLIDLYFDNEKQ